MNQQMASSRQISLSGLTNDAFSCEARISIFPAVSPLLELSAGMSRAQSMIAGQAPVGNLLRKLLAELETCVVQTRGACMGYFR